jgi:hypothetical protein
MEAILIAPCGMNCNIYARYLAFKNDVRKKGIKGVYCTGCLPQDLDCHYKRQCYRLGNKLVRFCYECEEFPCARLKRLDKRYRTKYYMSMIENLYYLRDNGIEIFLKKEEEKWRCPECGGIISCHNGICYTCGLEKLKVKKKRYRWIDD